ncbi:MAG: secondary thiamine-phosphate synthase enzyme YjbQ [Verrucomicrobiota bacterium]
MVASRGRGFHEVTAQVAKPVSDSRVTTGRCTLFLRHTSASLLIQENADPDVRADPEDFFARLAPDGYPRSIHTAEGDDTMAATIHTSLTSVNLSIPVRDGALALGT